MACDHSASHSGAARYLRGASQLQLMLVCDDCGAELMQLGRVDYHLEPRRLVVQVAEMISRELELSEAQTHRVRFASLVCGVGRDQMPASIVSKPGPLTAQEWVEVQRQPQLAATPRSSASVPGAGSLPRHRVRRRGRQGVPARLAAEVVAPGRRAPLEHAE